ncbi:MAG: O-antigen ligase family protein [Nitrospirae bacterium]|nr:O-antigen ligase family protein [Nitrospirota bacterium]
MNFLKKSNNLFKENPPIPPLLKGGEGGFFNAVIEKGIVLLLIFTPLAFGTVQDWSIAVMEIMAFIIFGAWLIQRAKSNEQRATTSNEQRAMSNEQRAMSILIFPAALILIAVFQIIPLPDYLLSLLSPSTSRLYKTFAGDMAGTWRTISIYQSATIDDIFKLTAYTVIFLVIINHYKTKPQVNSLARAIVYMGCFLAVFAVVQKMTWNGRLFWFYPVSEGLNSNMGHIWGPYIGHAHFAGYMEMAIPLAIGLLLYKTSTIKELPDLSLSKRIANLSVSGSLMPITLLSLAVMGMTGVLFISLSRGGIIGFTASMLFFTLLIRTRRTLRKKTGVIAMAGILILSVVLIAGWDRIEDRFEEIGEEGKIARTDIWKDTINMVRDFPVFGTGLGTFENIYLQYQTGRSRFLYEHAHNDYIEIFTDTGIAGFMIVITMLFFFFYKIIKAWRQRHNNFVKCMAASGLASCVAIAVHSFTDFNMRIPANALLLTVIAALTYATLNIEQRVMSPPRDRRASNEQ